MPFLEVFQAIITRLALNPSESKFSKFGKIANTDVKIILSMWKYLTCHHDLLHSATKNTKTKKVSDLLSS